MVIVVLSLLLAMIAGIGTAMIGQQRREATRQKLAGVETAIALFASQIFRLPCPADGRIAGTDPNAGRENPYPATGTCAGNQRYGVVPWRDLGLSEQDVTDGWGNRLTYRAATQFTLFPAMSMTSCDPGGSKTTPEPIAFPGGYCDPACSSANFPTNCTRPSAVTLNRGLVVRNLAGVATMDTSVFPSTGAAYVVISHGENGKGAYNSQGILQAAAGPDSGTEEAKNSADLVLAGYYVDDFHSYSSGTGHFDDFVLRPSILTVAIRAQLGPRAH